MKVPSYPFTPKSTAYLQPGQFWAVPLESGEFAYGWVLQIVMYRGKPDRRMFLWGLMDWISEQPPTIEILIGERIKTEEVGHIKTITQNGGQILGIRPLEADSIIPQYPLEAQHILVDLPDHHPYFELIKDGILYKASIDSVCSYKVISVLAESLFLEKHKSQE